MDFSFFEKYRDLALNTYHVDPVIFLIIYIVSVPICYYCLFVISKKIWKLKETHKLAGKTIIKNKKIINLLIIYQGALLAPYLYVLIWGDNLPWWVWFLLLSVILFSSYFFFLRIRKQNA